jgi:phospholipase C
MSAIDRRRFLQLAGGTAAMTALSSSIARAAAIPADRRSGTLRDVDHIVVLMQENRSFDHYFGTLRGVRGFGDPHPVNLPSGKPTWYQADASKQEILPFHPTAPDLGLQFIEDLPHDWNTTHEARDNGAYDRWIPAKGSTTMAYLTRDDIPFHYALADAFTVCDGYHCSLLGPTDPNRYYMWTGWVGNDGKGGGPVLDNSELGYGWTTYPERLEKAGISWKIYQDQGTGLDAAGSWGWTDDAYIGNYGDNSLLYFNQYRSAQPGNPLYEKARTGTDASSGQGFFDILKSDVTSGKLPQISWIVAPEAFTEHPNWPVNYGAWYVAQVLEALTADPAVWARTALFITYDENDGFFDHVVPPFPGTSTVDTTLDVYTNKGAKDPFVSGPVGLGVRVPMLVVSPWSKGGWVCSETFDHTSIIRFMERRFGVHEPNITPWRRAVCGDLTSAFDFGHTDTGIPSLPSTAGYAPPDRDRHPDYKPVPPAHPELPKQEPGVRPARPLPYDLTADGRIADGRLTVQFASHGQAGAVFQVTSAVGEYGPWSYTAAAGRSLTGSWPVSGAYDYSVHGPNGFLRRFAGEGAGVEVTARQAGRSAELVLTLVNEGTAAAEITLSDAYTHQVAAHTLRPGARVTHVVSTDAGHGWYDITLTGPTGHIRHLAGHLETGRPSTSDPAFG